MYGSMFYIFNALLPSLPYFFSITSALKLTQKQIVHTVAAFKYLRIQTQHQKKVNKHKPTNKFPRKSTFKFN